MKSADVVEKGFRSRPDHSWERYDGKPVEFLYEVDGKLKLLTGQLLVHPLPERQCIDVHYAGRLGLNDPPCSSYLFHVSGASAFRGARKQRGITGRFLH